MASVRAQPWAALEADNLTCLAEMTEVNLLKAIEERYRAGLIYSAVGDILVAVNPFQELPMYDGAWSGAYATSDVSGLAPHIFRVASAAYNSMVQGKKNQVCVISGESGAGKTESAKFIIKQVMNMCSSAGLGLKLQQKIIQLNPLLEAFGNARTELNDNSSRFGKFIQLLFESSGRIVGAGLEQYLLEKSRVCVQTEKERNFHIFYYLYAGLPQERKAQLHLKSPECHRYLKTYCSLTSDCTSPDSREAFSAVLESMESIGFSSSEVEQVVTLLAAILHIGDIEFTSSEEGGADSATIKNPELVETVAKLLCLESSDDLSFALTTLRTVTRGEPVDKLYTCSKAAVVRDAAAKALYARMFQWIVSRINTHLQPRDNSRSKLSVIEDHLNIGILDIFGFENFEANSFEQFCINLANEQLQQFFNHQIFAMEKMECAKEGVDDLDISYTDNTPVIDLFLTRPIGLLCLLDEQCKGLNGSEEAFVQRSRESFSKHQGFSPHRGNALEFTISHYAGDVTYEIEGFIEKNRDSLPEPVEDALHFTSLHLLGILFTASGGGGRGGGGGGGGRGDQLRKSFLRKSQRSVMRAMSQRRRKMSTSPKKRQRGNHKKLLTVSAHFRESLVLLMERLFAASPHFVRCIKPNLQKKPQQFESEFVLRQLRYTGMLEAVRVRREGYSYRPFFSDFVSSYRSIAYYFTDEDVKLTEGSCQVILEKACLTGWRLARSRVFLRYFHEQRLQLLLKGMEDSATLIQRMYRGHRARKSFKPLKEKGRLHTTQVASLLSQIAAHGQIHQPLLRALDRTDILEAPNRFKNREKETAPPPTKVGPSSADYDGLSTMQRKAKKAQKFGVKVGAVVGGADALQLVLKRRNSPGNTNRSRPPSENETASRPPSEIWVPSEIEGSRPPSVFEPSLESEAMSSRPPPPKYPPPHSKKAPPLPPGSMENESPHHSGSSPSSSPAHSRAALVSRESSPSHKKHPPPRTATKPTTSPRRNRRVLDPSSSRPINISVIPNHTTSSQMTSSSMTSSADPSPTHVQYSPVPKPRHNLRHLSAGDDSQSPRAKNSSSDAQNRRLSESILLSSSEMGSTDTSTPRGKRPIGGVKSLPNDKDHSNKREVALELLPSNLDVAPNAQSPYSKNSSLTPRTARGQENSSTRGINYSNKTSSSGMNTAQRRRLLASNVDGESTLDFARVGGFGPSNGRSEGHTRYISNSVPDLLEDPPTTNGPSPLPLGAPLTVNTPGRARGLALSSDLLYDVPTTDCYRGPGGLSDGGSGLTSRSTSQYSDMSAISGGSGVDTPPPQADKRKHKPWFGFKRSSRKKSSSSSIESEKQSPTPSPGGGRGGGRRESDTDILGFYPGIHYASAVEMVSGQPRGTYVLFKDELQEYSGASSVFKLGVSSGREVKMYPVLCTCGQYQLVTGAPQIHPSHPSLKSLVNHYKISELDDEMVLTQPRLVAGITVSLAPSNRQPQMARKRRKKN